MQQVFYIERVATRPCILAPDDKNMYNKSQVRGWGGGRNCGLDSQRSVGNLKIVESVAGTYIINLRNIDTIPCF